MSVWANLVERREQYPIPRSYASGARLDEEADINRSIALLQEMTQSATQVQDGCCSFSCDLKVSQNTMLSLFKVLH